MINSRIHRNEENGRFLRTMKVWSPENWEEGYFDNRGRFRVYRPDCPRAYKGGYALRAHVVWWIFHGEVHSKGTELHHKDGTRDNDHIENLIPLTNASHQILHKRRMVTSICLNCKKEFSRKASRVKERGAKFCSCKCFSEYPKISKRITRKCIECNEKFEVIPSSTKTLCSNRCAANFNWRIRHARAY